MTRQSFSLLRPFSSLSLSLSLSRPSLAPFLFFHHLYTKTPHAREDARGTGLAAVLLELSQARTAAQARDFFDVIF